MAFSCFLILICFKTGEMCFQYEKELCLAYYGKLRFSSKIFKRLYFTEKNRKIQKRSQAALLFKVTQGPQRPQCAPWQRINTNQSIHPESWRVLQLENCAPLTAPTGYVLKESYFKSIFMGKKESENEEPVEEGQPLVVERRIEPGGGRGG